MNRQEAERLLKVYRNRNVEPTEKVRAENVNSNIDVVEARRLMRIVTTLAKACAFTRLEAMKIAKVCMDCMDRIESEE